MFGMNPKRFCEIKLHKVEMEDEEIVENVQKGVKSRFYKNGKFSSTMKKAFIIFTN